MTHSVLVIEDDEKSQRLACDVLGHHGYLMYRAGSGEEALRFAQGAVVADVVLLDIQLPGIGGVETIHALRALPRWARVPVIAMTASVMPAERSTLVREGFDGFLAKPLAIRDLVAVVAAALSSAKG
jgi:two-component system, cell cycle response regulator DivK